MKHLSLYNALRTCAAAFAMCLACLVANADTMAGWYKFPSIGKDIDQIVQSRDKVYYLSGGTLFSFCPDDQESYAYSSLNALSDNGISSIHYNVDKGYLLIVYANNNLDLLYDNGKVRNLPDIKEAALADVVTINDVAFGNDRIALATSFGFVLYDDDKMEVRESGIYNIDVPLVAIAQKHLLLFTRLGSGEPFGLYASPLSERHNSIEKFTRLGSCNLRGMTYIRDNRLLVHHASRDAMQIYHLDFNRGVYYTAEEINLSPTGVPQRYRHGVFAYTHDALITCDGDNFATINLPSIIRGQKLATYDQPDQPWCANAQGIAQYDISASTPSVLYDRMMHPDAAPCGRVGFLQWSRDGQRLYVSNNEASDLRKYASELSPYSQSTCILSDGFLTDVSLLNASADHSKAKELQALNGDARLYGDPNSIIEDPDDPDIYYIATNLEGLYVVKYDPQSGQYEEIGKYTHRNTPLNESWGGSTRVEDVNIDPEGNLWVGNHLAPPYIMLPAAKRKQDPSTVTKSDWQVVSKLNGTNLQKKDMMSLFCKHSNMAFFISATYENGLVAVDTKGSYSNFDDDEIRHWQKFTDQDGVTFTPTYMTFLLEDRRGCIWIGTTRGVFEITNPEDATNSNFTVRRIKVARNDGTIYADYLLDSDFISYMAEDPAGRKWIATHDSGLFLVSETGDEILRNYTADNSPLPSNCVSAVSCDPNSNLVYVGTYDGLFSLLSDAAPAAEDYSDMYAYPNPVRPDYYGDVTITGLMDGSIVKIADQSGNVVYQTRAEGGMATWPVCNASGARVRSGVYYAFASTANSGSKAGKATKILVIN